MEMTKEARLAKIKKRNENWRYRIKKRIKMALPMELGCLKNFIAVKVSFFFKFCFQ